MTMLDAETYGHEIELEMQTEIAALHRDCGLVIGLRLTNEDEVLVGVDLMPVRIAEDRYVGWILAEKCLNLSQIVSTCTRRQTAPQFRLSSLSARG
jgi:hypothetical protein